MFEFQKQSDEGFRNKQRKELNNYHPKHNIWREVQDYWFDSHSKTIESKENINNLKEILSRENQANPLTWINNYINFLKYNSTIVEKKKVFPDQIGNFNYIRELHYDDSIPEILKDVYICFK